MRSNPFSRVLISIAGVPGSGKSTLSAQLSQILNEKIKTEVISQDGFHYYQSDLAKFKNAEEAFKRRGAPFTFDVSRFISLLKTLIDEKHRKEIIKAPSFDHEKKDPIEDDITIYPDTKIIIIEGNYVSLRDEEWNSIQDLVDEAWFLDTPDILSRSRLIRRHLEAGIATNEEEAEERADGSDFLNATYIKEKSATPAVLINTITNLE